jgi:hypothetical protein
MIFKVTHVDVQQRRRRARVTACSVDDCIAQIETALGAYVGLAVVRLAPRLVLCRAALEGEVGHA